MTIVMTSFNKSNGIIQSQKLFLSQSEVKMTTGSVSGFEYDACRFRVKSSILKSLHVQARQHRARDEAKRLRLCLKKMSPSNHFHFV